jgi:hypothetical protein
MMKSILAATLLSFGVASTAYALTLHPSSPTASSTQAVLQVKSNKNWNKNKNSWNKSYKKSYHKHGNYHAGWKYNSAPYGWHNYGYRPYRWAERGCIVVGPLWYCP